MTRKYLALIAVLLFVAAGLAAAQAPAANRAAIEKQIVLSERAVNEAIAKGDMKAFHANIAPDGVAVDAGGVNKVTGPDFDKMLLATKIQTWNIDSSQFYWVNDSTVVHIYKWTGKGTYQGQPVPSPTWSSTVWANKGGKWMAVFHQESLAMSAPAPAPTPAKK